MAWWTSRPAIGVGAGVVGLLVGVGMGAPAEDADLTAKVRTLTEQRGDLENQVLSLKDSVVDQDALDQQIDDAVTEARAEAAESEAAAVAAAVAKERQRAKRLVAEAKKSASPPPASKPKPTSGGGGTDPRFRTCGDANDAGYGPYRRGVDPEYDWYQDRDGDGIVCER